MAHGSENRRKLPSPLGEGDRATPFSIPSCFLVGGRGSGPGRPSPGAASEAADRGAAWRARRSGQGPPHPPARPQLPPSPGMTQGLLRGKRAQLRATAGAAAGPQLGRHWSALPPSWEDRTRQPPRPGQPGSAEVPSGAQPAGPIAQVPQSAPGPSDAPAAPFSRCTELPSPRLGQLRALPGPPCPREVRGLEREARGGGRGRGRQSQPSPPATPTPTRQPSRGAWSGR